MTTTGVSRTDHYRCVSYWPLQVCHILTTTGVSDTDHYRCVRYWPLQVCLVLTTTGVSRTTSDFPWFSVLSSISLSVHCSYLLDRLLHLSMVHVYLCQTSLSRELTQRLMPDPTRFRRVRRCWWSRRPRVFTYGQTRVRSSRWGQLRRLLQHPQRRRRHRRPWRRLLGAVRLPWQHSPTVHCRQRRLLLLQVTFCFFMSAPV